MPCYVITKENHHFGTTTRGVFSSFSNVFSVRFRWATTLIEYLFTAFFLVVLTIRYVWHRRVVPLLTRLRIPLIRKPTPISFQNDTVLITGGEQTFVFSSSSWLKTSSIFQRAVVSAERWPLNSLATLDVWLCWTCKRSLWTI